MIQTAWTRVLTAVILCIQVVGFQASFYSLQVLSTRVPLPFSPQAPLPVPGSQDPLLIFQLYFNESVWYLVIHDCCFSGERSPHLPQPCLLEVCSFYFLQVDIFKQKFVVLILVLLSMCFQDQIGQHIERIFMNLAEQLTWIIHLLCLACCSASSFRRL